MSLLLSLMFFEVFLTRMYGDQGNLVSADQTGIAMELDRSLQAVSRALGSTLVLALAFSTIVWSVLSTKLGKRPVSFSADKNIIVILTM